MREVGACVRSGGPEVERVRPVVLCCAVGVSGGGFVVLDGWELEGGEGEGGEGVYGREVGSEGCGV